MTDYKNSLRVKLLLGDAKVLIALDLDETDAADLAGFTIQCQPGTSQPYYLYNMLQFADPGKHAQVATEPANSSINAPFQKFRWLHVPGIIHQQGSVFYGTYTYTVTPRYFKNKVLQPIDKTRSLAVACEVRPFVKEGIELAFTRGFTQSQAFIRHFGTKTKFKPANAPLLFDTKAVAGIDNRGERFSYEDQYRWSGFTAREKIFELVSSVVKDKELFLDVMAYDLNEPDLLRHFLQLGREGRVRIALDNAPLHHDEDKPKPEDLFEQEFRKIDVRPSGKDAILRGNFKRYQHHKLLIISRGKERSPIKALSGSTNFSVTGMYANANHVVIFQQRDIVNCYQELFNTTWRSGLDRSAFWETELSKNVYNFKANNIPVSISFAPHEADFALRNLQSIVTRLASERSSILFAVMGTDPKTRGPVAPTLSELHARTDIFSAGITDSDNEITYYKPSSATGIRVTGLPGKTILPPPFAEEVPISIGHQVHHKFIVCGFNTPEAVVWLGSSNLAQGGEMENGDNLIEIHDRDIATVFAIEALALVDHFQFRGLSKAPAASTAVTVADLVTPFPLKAKPLPLRTDGSWAVSYFKPGDLHKLDRELFAK